jgi:hypothetical protein
VGLKTYIQNLSHMLDGDAWRSTKPLTKAERLAQWRIRQGEALAQEELRRERIGQSLDLVAASTARKPAKHIPFPDLKKRAKLKAVK